MIKQDNLQNVILDTHMLLWYETGTRLDENQVEIIKKASNQNKLYVCAITFWEIATLFNKKKISFAIDLKQWVNKTIQMSGMNIINLSPHILLKSCCLPNYEHKDPADRIIIAASREYNAHLMTADKQILEYSKKGYLKTI